MKRALVRLSAALVMFASGVNAQHVYKWNDAQGVTHYTDQPPPAGHAASTMDLKAAATPVSTSVTATLANTPTTAGDTSGSALATAEASAKTRNCERAKANAATLSSGAMLVDSTDPRSAKRLDEYEVKEAKRNAQADVETYCGTGGK